MKDYYVTNIEEATLENDSFRRVVYTDSRMQLVLMCLAPQEDIGEEVHNLDQFIRIEEGEGLAILNGEKYTLTDGSAVIIPAGVRHNIMNVSTSDPLQLYTLYAPPNHPHGLIQAVKSTDEHKATRPYQNSDPEYDPKHECS